MIRKGRIETFVSLISEVSFWSQRYFSHNSDVDVSLIEIRLRGGTCSFARPPAEATVSRGFRNRSAPKDRHHFKTAPAQRGRRRILTVPLLMTLRTSSCSTRPAPPLWSLCNTQTHMSSSVNALQMCRAHLLTCWPAHIGSVPSICALTASWLTTQLNTLFSPF